MYKRQLCRKWEISRLQRIECVDPVIINVTSSTEARNEREGERESDTARETAGLADLVGLSNQGSRVRQPTEGLFLSVINKGW